jgi:hypothetical protein
MFAVLVTFLGNFCMRKSDDSEVREDVTSTLLYVLEYRQSRRLE